MTAVVEEITAQSLAAMYKEAYETDDESVRDALLAEYRAQVETLEPVHIGPTWKLAQDRSHGKYELPQLTLGWQIIAWINEYVNVPEKGLTSEQIRFILWWYAIDEDGEFIYGAGVLQRCKGWGKDPIMAIVCLVEFVGPCRFSHWDEDKNPVAMQCPDAWVQITAVAQSQAEKNTGRLFPSYISQKMIDAYGIKSGIELWRAENGTRFMEMVTSNPDTIEGGRPTFIVLNETHRWRVGNRGVEMYEVIDGNASKVKWGGRYLAITNAFMPGQGSVAELMREAWEKIEDGRAFDVGFFYDSIEADERSPMTPEAMEIILPKVRGDAVWLSIKKTISSALFTARTITKSRRMYYNQVVAAEDALYGPHEWKALLDDLLELLPGDRIVLGFDGSRTRDATALVAIRVKDKAIFLLGLWEKPDGFEGDWMVPRAEVDSMVAATFKRYKVVGFYADVREWTSYIDNWHEKYADKLLVKSAPRGNSIAWDMRRGGGATTYAHERLHEAIKGRQLKHNGDKRLRRHVLSTRERWNNWGLSFGKDGDGAEQRIDAYAALVLAFECLHDFRTRPLNEETPPTGGQVWFF